MKSLEKVVFYDDDKFRFVVEFLRGRAYVHLLVRRWSRGVMRLMLRHWPDFRALMGRIGHKMLWTYYKDENIMMDKFALRFGFCEVRRAGGLVLMRC